MKPKYPKILMILMSMFIFSNLAFAAEFIRASQGFQAVVSLEKVNLRESGTTKKIKTDIEKHVEQDLSKLTANRKTILSKP